MVKVDTSESKAEGGGGSVEAGEYHWTIEEVSVETFDGVQSLKVVSTVEAGNPASQVGHKHTEFFNLSGKAVDRLRRLLVATQIMTDEQWVANIGKPLDFDEMLLKSRQYCARVKVEPYQGKKPEHQGKSFPRIGFDIWSIWDEKAKHIPKNAAVTPLMGRPAGEVATAPAAAKPATAPQSNFKW